MVAILEDKGIAVLDYGPNDVVNKKLLDYGQRIVFSSVLNGIRAQFSAEHITQAKFKGDTVFAIPIPEKLLWLERRGVLPDLKFHSPNPPIVE